MASGIRWHVKWVCVSVIRDINEIGLAMSVAEVGDNYVLKIISNKNNDLMASLKAKCDKSLGRKMLGQGEYLATLLDFARESAPQPFGICESLGCTAVTVSSRTVSRLAFLADCFGLRREESFRLMNG